MDGQPANHAQAQAAAPSDRAADAPRADTPRADARPKRAGTRFLFLDGLRGVGAIAVVLYHLCFYRAYSDRLEQLLPDWWLTVVSYAWVAVPMFFALSGFVIAYRLRDAWVTPRYLADFAVRRSIRLDPPYWAVIILVLIINAASNPFRPGREIFFPGWKVVAAHACYAQEMLGMQELDGAFWTLCYEVQCYLVLVLLLGLAQHLPTYQRRIAGVRHATYLWVFAPVAIFSVLVAAPGEPWPRPWEIHQLVHIPHGLFIDRWYAFFLGAVVWAAIDGAISTAWMWGFMCLITASIMKSLTVDHDSLSAVWRLADLLTALAMFAAAKFGRMDRWLASRPIQFFGRISYSLYLLHMPIGRRMLSIGRHYNIESAPAVLLWMALSFAVSVLAAYVFYRLVEQPAIKLAKKVRIARPAAAKTPQTLRAAPALLQIAQVPPR